MAEYKPVIKSWFSELPEIGSAALGNNAYPAIMISGSEYPTIQFGEMVNGKFQTRVGLGHMDLKETDAETALKTEAKTFGKHSSNFALIYNGKTIQEGKAISQKRDATPYEIRLEAPSSFQIRDNYGADGGTGKITLYGLDINNMTGFNAGEQSKEVGAFSIGFRLNYGEDSVIKGFLPFGGNRDYFIQGKWTHTNLMFDMGFEARDVAYVMRRNGDRTIEVIPVHDSFKEVVTPEAVQRVIQKLKKN